MSAFCDTYALSVRRATCETRWDVDDLFLMMMLMLTMRVVVMVMLIDADDDDGDDRDDEDGNWTCDTGDGVDGDATSNMSAELC